MAQLYKLTPDRDLQCYFEQPSAIAAMSGASDEGFTVSGTWRQQFDWAVVEWNRDNTIEHPALRNLPDGDLSGLLLSYEEERTNCAPMDSKTYDSVGWSYLRVWEVSGGSEHFHWIPLMQYAAPVAGSYTQATATFELQGTPSAGDYIELAWLDRHANAIVGASLGAAVEELAGFINAQGEAGGVTAAASGTTITLTYTGAVGANGNRVGVYGGVHGAGTETWSPGAALFSGGVSPTRWRVELDFSNLTDSDLQPVTTTNVRKMRWTWAAELQWGQFERQEFSAVVSDWQVTGSGREYEIAGAGSRRIEDDAAGIGYTGSWSEARGNYSGGSIRRTQRAGDTMQVTYTASAVHRLYLGTRCLNNGGAVTVQVDSGAAVSVNLNMALDDYLIRVPLGEFSAASHTVAITHSGADWTDVFFDFLELAIAAADLPEFTVDTKTTLATDWDTNHSLAIAAERSAWLVNTLGFKGRANHYVGALKFYELRMSGNVYASGTIEFSGTPEFGGSTEIVLAGMTIPHLNYITDTPATIAKAFELLITAGSSAVWAHADGAVLTIVARAMGLTGDAISMAASTGSELFTAAASGTTLTGGVTGKWLTDLDASPRLNRAARDWSRSYFQAVDGYGIAVTAAFSMELGDGDDSLAAGIAQRYPNGPVLLNTPALQTNFGPQSVAYWRQVYLDMADLMVEAGVAPYLQFGEVQWWYFANVSGMPFYDAYTMGTFQATYGHPIAAIANQHVDAADYPEEAVFLPGLIGAFTEAVMDFVREMHPSALFEVLYAPDVNDARFTRVVNFPEAVWSPENLSCLKTENFTYTGNRNLDQARDSIGVAGDFGFPPEQSSHLIGIGEYTTPWLREHSMSISEGMESVVLFALDQFCLIGYGVPLGKGRRRAQFMGR